MAAAVAQNCHMIDNMHHDTATSSSNQKPPEVSAAAVAAAVAQNCHMIDNMHHDTATSSSNQKPPEVAAAIAAAVAQNCHMIDNIHHDETYNLVFRLAIIDHECKRRCDDHPYNHHHYDHNHDHNKDGIDINANTTSTNNNNNKQDGLDVSLRIKVEMKLTQPTYLDEYYHYHQQEQHSMQTSVVDMMKPLEVNNEYCVDTWLSELHVIQESLAVGSIK